MSVDHLNTIQIIIQNGSVGYFYQFDELFTIQQIIDFYFRVCPLIETGAIHVLNSFCRRSRTFQASWPKRIQSFPLERQNWIQRRLYLTWEFPIIQSWPSLPRTTTWTYSGLFLYHSYSVMWLEVNNPFSRLKSSWWVLLRLYKH